MRTTFVEIENRHFINRDHVISVRYICAGMWRIYTDDGSEYECRNEKAITAILYGDPNHSTTERREPNAFEVFDEKTVNAPSTDWVAQADGILKATYCVADGKTDIYRIYRGMYARVCPAGDGYTVIIRTTAIDNCGSLVASINVKPLTGIKNSSVADTLTSGERQALEELVAILPTN